MNVVVMAGGTGSRLWPSSRGLYPKQFLSLVDGMTMLQTTLSRIDGLDVSSVSVICNEEHRFIVAQQGMEAKQQIDRIILEPVGRNTAPAIALAALSAIADGHEKSPLLILAADHVINDVDQFLVAIRQAELLAKQGKLVTFGIVPTQPHTGYGYIKAGDAEGEGFAVEQFVEKPSLEVASQYLAEGGYYWNSGMFVMMPQQYLDELLEHAPEIYSACEAAFDSRVTDSEFVRIDAPSFSACPDDSVDYALMEKTSNAVVVPFAGGWDDVGSWTSLANLSLSDADGNVHKGDVVTHQTSNNYVRAENRLVATLGVSDIVVVETKDAVLVAHKSSVQDVKAIVNQLKASGREEVTQHRQVHRPWGLYDAIEMGDRYQVKHITVNPGAKLSLQMHHHRAEHWIVVSGTAKVTNGEVELLLSENQSTYIPIGTVHALENPGKVPLEMIEVQSGSYLGEDDIVRFEDRYGRS